MAARKPAKQGGDFIENLIMKFIELTTPAKKKKEDDSGQKYTRPFSFRLTELEETLFKNRKEPLSHLEKERYTAELHTYRDDEMLMFKHLSREIHDMQAKLDSTPRSDRDEIKFLQIHINKVRKERNESKQVLEQIRTMLRKFR